MVLILEVMVRGLGVGLEKVSLESGTICCVVNYR